MGKTGNRRKTARADRGAGRVLALIAASGVALALAFAGSANADSSAPASGEFVETPVGAAPAPAPANGTKAARPKAEPGQTADNAGFKPTPMDPVFNAAPMASEEFIEAPVAPSGSAATPAPASGGPFSFLSTASRSASLLGDMWGLRPALAKYGMTLAIVENSEVFGNATGGVARGVEYNGLTTATLQLDAQRAFNWNGGLFNVSAEQIHGGNLSQTNLYSLQTASGIEADRATRLWELWYQQKFGDAFDVKLGQQSLDQEFMVSQNASYFINTMFGWPMLPSADLPGGGPAYPLSALGVRARDHVSDTVTVLAGVFNGSPTYNNKGDPQHENPSGVSFPLNGGVLAIAELQFQYPGSGTLVKADEADPLARTYKIGVWYDSESFADFSHDNTGLSLANPASNGVPVSRHGDYAIYAVADQMLWRDKDPDRNINFFIRPMFTPLQDRNLISFSLNAGLTMHEPIPGRDDDTAGIGMGFAQVSNGAIANDKAVAFYNPGVYAPIRSNETYVEATYQYQPAPWLQIQPDLQYVINPGAGVVNPYRPTQSIRSELVLGLRGNITF